MKDRLHNISANAVQTLTLMLVATASRASKAPTSCSLHSALALAEVEGQGNSEITIFNQPSLLWGAALLLLASWEAVVVKQVRLAMAASCLRALWPEELVLVIVLGAISFLLDL